VDGHKKNIYSKTANLKTENRLQDTIKKDLRKVSCKDCKWTELGEHHYQWLAVAGCGMPSGSTTRDLVSLLVNVLTVRDFRFSYF
jgi:hypothetical protein